MSKPYTVSQINDLEDDIAVPAFKGKVKQIFKRHTGNNARGDYSFQGIILVDADGDEIEAKLKDRDELPAKLKGKHVCIVSHKGDRGWTGVKTKDDEYQGKTKRILWITGSAEIVPGENMPAEGDDVVVSTDNSDPAATASSQQDDPPARANHPANHPAKPTQGDPVRDAKVAALKRANLLAIAVRAADSMLQVYHDSGKVNPTPELHQACTMSIFISMDRQGMADDLPVAPVYPSKPDGDLEPQPKSKK